MRGTTRARPRDSPRQGGCHQAPASVSGSVYSVHGNVSLSTFPQTPPQPREQKKANCANAKGLRHALGSDRGCAPGSSWRAVGPCGGRSRTQGLGGLVRRRTARIRPSVPSEASSAIRTDHRPVSRAPGSTKGRHRGLPVPGETSTGWGRAGEARRTCPLLRPPRAGILLCFLERIPVQRGSSWVLLK